MNKEGKIDSTVVAKNLNKHFSTVGKKLSVKFKTNWEYKSNIITNSIDTCKTNSEEVINYQLN